MNPIRLTLFDHFMCTKNGTVFGNGVKIQLSGINTDFIPISHQHHEEVYFKIGAASKGVEWGLDAYLKS